MGNKKKQKRQSAGALFQPSNMVSFENKEEKTEAMECSNIDKLLEHNKVLSEYNEKLAEEISKANKEEFEKQNFAAVNEKDIKQSSNMENLVKQREPNIGLGKLIYDDSKKSVKMRKKSSELENNKMMDLDEPAKKAHTNSIIHKTTEKQFVEWSPPGKFLN
jgi:hypothetical protein